MNINKIIIGWVYRHKDHPDFCFAKVIKILKPKEDENSTTKTVVKCEYSQDKNFRFGLVKYFKPSDLIEK